MPTSYHIPEHLHPRIHGIDKLLEVFGPEDGFHDSEVEEIVIDRNREVRIRIWSGWRTAGRNTSRNGRCTGACPWIVPISTPMFAG